jgi:site-specific recombinase XerD
MRAFVVLLWRAGLRITEALTVTEHDLDPRPGAIRVRHGKRGRRREVGDNDSRGCSPTPTASSRSI